MSSVYTPRTAVVYETIVVNPVPRAYIINSIPQFFYALCIVRAIFTAGDYPIYSAIHSL